MGQVLVPEDSQLAETPLEEVTVVKDVDLAGNASLGLVVDRPRNRLLVAVADVIGNRYGGLAAYDLSTWKRLFLTHLSGPSKFETQIRNLVSFGADEVQLPWLSREDYVLQ